MKDFQPFIRQLNSQNVFACIHYSVGGGSGLKEVENHWTKEPFWSHVGVGHLANDDDIIYSLSLFIYVYIYIYVHTPLYLYDWLGHIQDHSQKTTIRPQSYAVSTLRCWWAQWILLPLCLIYTSCDDAFQLIEFSFQQHKSAALCCFSYDFKFPIPEAPSSFFFNDVWLQLPSSVVMREDQAVSFLVWQGVFWVRYLKAKKESILFDHVFSGLCLPDSSSQIPNGSWIEALVGLNLVLQSFNTRCWSESTSSTKTMVQNVPRVTLMLPAMPKCLCTVSTTAVTVNISLHINFR